MKILLLLLDLAEETSFSEDVGMDIFSYCASFYEIRWLL